MLLPVIYSVGFLYYFGEGTTLWNWVTVTFLANIWVASVALFRDRQPYSINRMFWVFMLVFLAMVPALQLATGMLPWNKPIPLEVALRANLLILGGAVVYQLTRYVLAAVTGDRPPLFPSRIGTGWVRASTTAGTAIFLLLALTYFFIVGADALFLQKDILARWRGRVSDTLYLTIENGLRSPVLYFCLLMIFLYRLRRISKSQMSLVLAVGLLVNFPLAMQRTLAAAVIISLVLSFGGTYWQRNRQAFTWLLLVGIVGIYPLLHVVRSTSSRMAPPISKPAQVYSWGFQRGDFDGYSMLCQTIAFTDTAGFQQGRQLRTALGFAVPRHYWPQKSVGSGALVRQKGGDTFTNVASPLPAEGFIDFGPVGALLYFMLFAILARQYDCYYWYWRNHRAATGDVSFRALFYPVMLVLLFHLLRGDLLSSLTQLVALYGSAWAFHHVLRLAGKWAFPKTIS